MKLGLGFACAAVMSAQNPSTVWNSNPLVYQYSIVSGGLWSSDQVDVAANLPHYAGLGAMSIAQLRKAERRYASYRRLSQIYWTAEPLQLQAHEFVWVDANGHMIRARCGNRLEAKAQTPIQTAGEAPKAEEFDSVVPPLILVPPYLDIPQNETTLPPRQIAAATPSLPLAGAMLFPLTTSAPYAPIVPAAIWPDTGSDVGSLVAPVSAVPAAAAPEPATSWLMLAGLLTLGISQRFTWTRRVIRAISLEGGTCRRP